MAMRTRADILNDLRALGVRPGAIVMAHASLRAIGPVEGGAASVLDALEQAVEPDGALMMVLGAENDWAWVNERPEEERAALLAEAVPFDPLTTPAEEDVGYLAEALRTRSGVQVTDNPEGRFAALGAKAPALLANAPWDDYYGPGSPLAHLCEMNGAVLRMGADPDTTTLLHYAEYLVDIPNKRRVTRHRRVLGPNGPEIRTVSCLDDSNGIVPWEGEDYFKTILEAYLREGRARTGRVGNAKSELIDANDLVDFGVRWMRKAFA
jgi:aminoglycoside N3'-acetyltransferase